MPSATLGGPSYKAAGVITNIVGGLVKNVTWRLDNQANTCEIEVPRKRIQEFRRYNAGKRVYVKVRKSQRTHILFHGYVTGRFIEYTPDSETVAFLAQGPRWHMEGDFVKGRYMLGQGGSYDVFSGHKAIFNEKLQGTTLEPGNGDIVKDSATGVRPFSLDPRVAAETTPYTVNDMIWYCYYVGRNWHTPTVIDDVLSLTEHGIGDTLGLLTPPSVNVDGLNITAAFDAVMKASGLRWWCKPASTTVSDLKAFIPGPSADTPKKYVYLANVSAGVSPQTEVTLSHISTGSNNTEAGRINEDYAEIYNEIYAYGPPKLWQTKFTLKPGWSTSNYANNLMTQSVSQIQKQLREKSSTAWSTWKDTGRKWVLDEDGSISGMVFDFSTLFGHTHWAAVRRPFAGQRVDENQFDAIEVVSAVDGTDKKLEKSVRLLQHQGGVRVEGEVAAPPTLDTTNKDLAAAAKFTAAVAEDDALEANNALLSSNNDVIIAGEIGGDSVDITRRKAILLESEYQTDNVNSTKETQVQSQIVAVVNRKLQELQNPKLSGSFSIPWISVGYDLGDRILGIRGRNIWLTSQIIEIRYEFGEVQRTELIAEDLRLAES